jgi:hypothetical protein
LAPDPSGLISQRAPRSARDFLRKDYAYLFERFYHLVESRSGAEQGLVVFDELERVQSHLLVDQMARYFQETATGRRRAARVIPEPFFVHSHLTTGVQLADLVAYVISWNVRVGQMGVERRDEMDGLGEAVRRLAPRFPPGQGPRRPTVQPIAVIADLRPRDERGLQASKEKGNAGEPAKPPPT